MNKISRFISNHPWVIPTIVFTLLILGAAQMHELWGDEAETALFGRNILKYGVPRGWDGTNIMGINNAVVLDKNLINHTSPWLQYYLVAASFKLFGESSFTARLPFIILAIFTQPLLYYVAKKITGDKVAAMFAGIISALSVQGILFGFQARYYQATNFFGLLLLLSAWKILQVLQGTPLQYCKGVPLKSIKLILWPLVFIISATGFFYANYVSFAAFFLAVMISICIYSAWLMVSLRAERSNTIMAEIASFIRGFIFRIGILVIPILALTLPWYVIVQPFTGRGVIALGSLSEFFYTYSTLLWEGIYPFHHNGSLPVLLIFIAVLIFISRLINRKPVGQILFWFGLPFLYLLIMDLFSTLAYVDTVFVHARYTTVILPVIYIFVGLIFANLWRMHKFIAVTIFCIYLFTNFLSLETPRSYLFYLIREIYHPYQTPEVLVADFLKSHAQKGDTAFVNLDRDHEPLIWLLGTRLKFINRVSLVNTRIFPQNRGIIPRYIYDFRAEPDWVILYSKRGDDGTFFTADYRPVPPEINLQENYLEHKLPIFFSDTTRPEIDRRSFRAIIPTDPVDFVYIYEKKKSDE